MILIDILTALAVLVAVGLLFGILLALVIRFFGIEDDATTKKVREALPGINCGACGFKGCNDYAEALAKGLAKPNLCIPGAEATAAEISAILGVEAEAPEDKVAFVACNGTCDAITKKAEYNGVSTCRAASMFYAGPLSCRYGCLGCGDCANVCISKAISVVDGVAVVDTALCVGCGLCVKTCPKKIISMVPQETPTVVMCSNKDKGADARKSCKNACIGCKKCEKVCPEQAIRVVNNCAEIDYSKCTGCGACAKGCPMGCIRNVSFPDLPEDFDLKAIK